jgi:hypothetical protein
LLVPLVSVIDTDKGIVGLRRVPLRGGTVIDGVFKGIPETGGLAG